MILISKLLQISKLVLLGMLVGLLILFFMPKSPISFNWVEVNKVWHHYLQSSQEEQSSSQQENQEPPQVFSFAKAVEKAGPSVVSIKALSRSRARPARDGREGDMLVDISFNAGSGVIFDSDGYIVTNYHVIAGSYEIGVHFSNGRYKRAEVVGVDRDSDIAVLKVDIETPNVAELAQYSNVKAGDIVLAIGTPFGLFENSVTSGIVSSVDHASLYPRIQTDVAINYGNSGGALINTLGQVIGISSSKFKVKRNSEASINFGIPVDVVKEIFDEIKIHGRVVKNWLGSKLEQLNKSGHKYFDPGAEFGLGLLIAAVEKDSPVEQAGMISRDYLLKFDGVEITSMKQFKKHFLTIPIGKEVDVEFLRNKEPHQVKLELREKPLKPKI